MKAEDLVVLGPFLPILVLLGFICFLMLFVTFAELFITLLAEVLMFVVEIFLVVVELVATIVALPFMLIGGTVRWIRLPWRKKRSARP